MLRLNRRRSVIGDNHMATGPDQCCQATPDGLRAIAEKPEFELNVDDVGLGYPIDDVAKGGIGRFLSKLRVAVRGVGFALVGGVQILEGFRRNRRPCVRSGCRSSGRRPSSGSRRARPGEDRGQELDDGGHADADVWCAEHRAKSVERSGWDAIAEIWRICCTTNCQTGSGAGGTDSSPE